MLILRTVNGPHLAVVLAQTGSGPFQAPPHVRGFERRGSNRQTMRAVAHGERYQKASLLQMSIGKDILHLVDRRCRYPALLASMKQFGDVPLSEPVPHQECQCVGIAAAGETIFENFLPCPFWV